MERQRRILQHLCLYCGAEGHLISSCPIRPPRPAVSTIQLPSLITLLTITAVIVTKPQRSVSVQAPTDSRSAGNFISLSLMQELNLKKKPMHRSFEYPLHTGKTTGPWSHLILHSHSNALHWMSSSGTDLVQGAGRFYFESPENAKNQEIPHK